MSHIRPSYNSLKISKIILPEMIQISNECDKPTKGKSATLSCK